MAAAPKPSPALSLYQRPVILDEDWYNDDEAVYNKMGKVASRSDYEYDDEGYAVSDNLSMAEHDVHQWNAFNTISGLNLHFTGDVYVAGNNFLHYRREDELPPRKRTRHIAPDCYVVFGVTKRIRPNYKSWEYDGKMPAIVFEFTSRKTRKRDTEFKKVTYETVLHIPEYILFDPFGDYLTPKLQGYRSNSEGTYEPIPLVDGRMYSEQLDLWLVIHGYYLRLYDEKTGEYLRTYEEAEAERAAALTAADDERRRANREQRRATAEAHRASNAERRADVLQQQFETNDAMAREAIEIAQRESRARQEKEAEIERLQAELENLRRQQNG